jgi:hypothetical protein
VVVSADKAAAKAAKALRRRETYRTDSAAKRRAKDKAAAEKKAQAAAVAAGGPAMSFVPLGDWLLANIDNPYPTGDEKQQLMAASGTTSGQLKNYFGKYRQRITAAIAPHARTGAPAQPRRRSSVNRAAAAALGRSHSTAAPALPAHDEDFGDEGAKRVRRAYDASTRPKKRGPYKKKAGSAV